MPGHQLANSLEQRLFATGVAEGKVFGEQLLVELSADIRMLQKCLDLRGEGEQAAVPEVVEGLDAQAVADTKQPPVLSVPDGIGEHPAKPRNRLVAPLFVGVDGGLGVAVALVAVSRGFKLRADVGVIVDLAVVRDPERVVLIRHRLTAGGEVDDAQPPMAQRDFTMHVESGCIGTAVGDDVRHRANHTSVGGGAVRVQESRYATHKTSIAPPPPTGGRRRRRSRAGCSWEPSSVRRNPVYRLGTRSQFTMITSE